MKSKKALTRLAVVISVLGLASTALAGSLTNYQRITLIQANSLSGSNPNYVVVNFDANLTGSPSCASGNLNAITFDATTANGKTRLSLFQAAMLAGKSVRITGQGTCTGGVENLGWAGFAD